MRAVYDTWAERDLDEYLERYAKGSDETERRLRTCAFCGDNFDMDDGKLIETYGTSPIRIRGKRPDYLYICDSCLRSADEIREDDDYEY